MKFPQIKNLKIKQTESALAKTHKTASPKYWFSQLKSENFQINHVPKFAKLTGLLLALIFGALLVINSSQYPVGYAYSDELLATAYNLGLSRPPGQALYIIILHFFLNLPIPGTIALRGAVFSAFLQSTALYFSFLSSWLVLTYYQQKINRSKQIFVSQSFDSIFFSLIASILIGLTSFMWLYGSIAEVPAFASLCLSLTIWLLSLILFTDNANNFRQHLYLWIFYGIALVNIPALIFLLPVLLLTLIIYKTNIKKVFLVAFSFSSAVLLNIILIVLLSYSQNPLSWKLERSIQGLWHYFSDNSFGQNIIWNGFGKFISESLPVIGENYQNFLGLGLILIVLLGLKTAISNSRKISLLFALVILLNLVYPILINWSNTGFNQIIILRQYAFFGIILSLPLALGLMLLIQRLSMVFSLISMKKKLWILAVICFFVITITLKISANLNRLNPDELKNWSLIYQDILHKLPRHAMLVCGNEYACGTLLYFQQAEALRQDVSIVPYQYPLAQNHLEKLKLRQLNYQKQPYIAFDLITWNLDKMPIFVTGINQSLHDALGMSYGFTYYVSLGYYGQLVRELPDQLPSFDARISDDIRSSKFDDQDPVRNLHLETVASEHIFNAQIFQRMGFREKATAELNLSSNLLYEIDTNTDDEVELIRTNIENQSPTANWQLGSKTQTAAEIIKIAEQNLTKKNYKQAIIGAAGAITIEPKNVAGRLLLAKIYDQVDMQEAAILEYQNVLIIDPSNMEAGRFLQGLDAT